MKLSPAALAASAKVVPHKGRFHECDNVHAEVWIVGGVRVLHLVIRKRYGGSYVLRLTPDAAELIAQDIGQRVLTMSKEPTIGENRAEPAPMFAELLKILGWSGGTIHAALKEVESLKAFRSGWQQWQRNAFEFGFRCREKNMNLEAALDEFNKARRS